MDSTNHGWEKKNLIPETSKKQNLNLPGTDKYLHSIYTVLGIISNLQMIQITQEDVCRLYANTMPFYIRDLGICRFWYPGGPENQSSKDIYEQPYTISFRGGGWLVNDEEREQVSLKSGIVAFNAMRMNM